MLLIIECKFILQHYVIHCNGLLHREQVALVESGLVKGRNVSLY